MEKLQEKSFNLGAELQKTDSGLIDEVLAIIELDPLTREKERTRISKKYNVRKKAIDLYIAEFINQKKIGGTTEIVTETEPASKSISGDELLSAIRDELLKYIILPCGIAEPIAAWVVLTYCYDAFRILPMLGIISPVKRCGKTTLLEILQGLTNKGLTASNISSAAVFRTIEKYSPTLLVDEADTFLKDNDELRGVLNSGHTRATAFVVRIEGEDHEPVKFSTWAPKAIAMIGTLPDTLHDRSVVVSLRRKAPGETVSRIDLDFENGCTKIRQACRRWADDNMDILRTRKVSVPTTNNDRVTDNWMPLLAIAEVAGGDWPKLLQKSMLGTLDGTDDSIGPALLKDIQEIFESYSEKRIFSDYLVHRLNCKAESPWSEWTRGKALTQNGLARLLRPFKIRSKTMRINEDRRNGYELNSFKDAFNRYIPLVPPVSSVTVCQVNNINNLNIKQGVTDKNDVTGKKQLNLLKSHDCHTVTDERVV
jgi:putative DNA primase/helicase